MAKRRTRGVQSRIRQAPEEIRERINALLLAGAAQTDILEATEPLCRKHGIAPFSRSAMSRHAIRTEEVVSAMRRHRDMAEILVRKAGLDPDSRTAVLLGEMLKGLSLEWLSDHIRQLADPETGETDFSAVNVDAMSKLALLTRRLVSAERESVHLQAERRTAAAAAAREAALEAGVDEDAANEVRDILLGRDEE